MIKARSKSLLELKGCKQRLDHNQPSEGRELLIFKTNLRNLMDSTVNRVSATLHFEGPPGLDILCLCQMHFIQYGGLSTRFLTSFLRTFFATDGLMGRCRKRQNGNIAGPFDSDGYFSLVLCTVSGDPTRNDLSTFRNEKSKDLWILIIDIQLFVSAESTDLSPQERFFPSVLRGSFSRFSHSLLLYLLT